jgi:hypothetical protein
MTEATHLVSRAHVPGRDRGDAVSAALTFAGAQRVIQVIIRTVMKSRPPNTTAATRELPRFCSAANAYEPNWKLTADLSGLAGKLFALSARV